MVSHLAPPEPLHLHSNSPPKYSVASPVTPSDSHFALQTGVLRISMQDCANGLSSHAGDLNAWHNQALCVHYTVFKVDAMAH